MEARGKVRSGLRKTGTWVYEMNEIDRLGLCPHQIEGLEEWDFGSGEELDVVISDRKVVLRKVVSVNHIRIESGGMLVFGEPEGEKVELRAKSIIVTDGGEFWIGSRSCRYEHEGHVTLYGNHTDMVDHPISGQKYLWCREEERFSGTVGGGDDRVSQSNATHGGVNKLVLDLIRVRP